MRILLSIAVSSGLILAIPAYAQAPDTIPPDNMVKAPSVDAIGEQHVNLSWEALKDNVGVVAYRVYYSENSYLSKSQAGDGAAQFARFKQVTEPRATIDGLTKGKKYYFTVTGLDGAGNESEYVATEAEATIGQGTSSPIPSASQKCTTQDQCATGNFCYWISDGPQGPGDPSGPQGDGVCHKRCSTDQDCVSSDRCIQIGRQCMGDVCTAKESFCAARVSPSPTPGVVTTSSSPNPVPTPVLLTENEITDLTATLRRMAETYDVSLEWKLPSVATGNIAQILYQGNAGSSLAKLATLLPTATSYVAERLTPGRYDFKVATIGPDGVETAGVSTSIELVATGPSLLLAGLASLAGVIGVRKRRKQADS